MNDKSPLGMREARTADGEASSIRLLRSIFSGTFLFVEGCSDKVFYGRFINETTCKVKTFTIPGKLRVIEVLTILEESGFQGVLAIVDADCDRLSPFSHPSSNLLCTDTHDLETLILKSFALNKVIAEFGSEEKIAKFGREIRTVLLEAGMIVGYLRWISLQNDLNLTFESIRFSEFVDEQTLQIDEYRLIREVRNKSQAFSLNSEDLQQQLTIQKSSSHDPWQICCGHDLVEILSLSLRKTIGSARKAANVERIILEKSLRLAYEEAYFCETQLCLDIRKWESLNSPFMVLRT